MAPDKPVSPDEWIEIEYHLKGLVEAGQAIAKFSRVLGPQLEQNFERATDTLAELEVEVFFHLGYHIKALRRPFRRLTRLTYRLLDQAEREKKAKRPSSKRSGPGVKRPSPSSKKSRRRAPGRGKQ